MRQRWSRRRQRGTRPSDPAGDPDALDRSPATTFADRHLGPRPEDVERDARRPRRGHPRRADRPGGAQDDPHRPAAARCRTPAPSPRCSPRCGALADRNEVVTSLIGAGYSGTHTPGVIQRNVLENPAWYTAYTPYQPEISQGRLEALLNFQTMVTDLTGMDIANASMLDESTAAAEAMTLIRRSTKHASRRVLRRRRDPSADDRRRRRPRRADRHRDRRRRPRPTSTPPRCSARSCSTRAPPAWCATSPPPSPPSTTPAGWWPSPPTCSRARLLTPPGEQGADVCVGSSQRFGVPLGYGGPHAGFLATRDELRRSMPGRLVGVSVDAAGRPAHRLALQTREQHIRREKATSNICTAQVLLAVIASMYAVYHGPEGLRHIAERVHGQAARLAASAARGRRRGRCTTPSSTRSPSRVPGRADEVAGRRAASSGVNLRRVDDDTVGHRARRDHRPTTSSTARGRGLRRRRPRRRGRVGASRRRCAAPPTYLTHPVFSTPPLRDRDAALPAPARPTRTSPSTGR